MALALDADRLVQRVQYDLLSNPFAVLRLSVGASREDVASSFDDAMSEGLIPDEELREARRHLLAPKLRAFAVAEFLPDADDSVRSATVEALRRNAADSILMALASDLPAFSRVVFLSNIAQLRPSSNVLKLFILALADVDRTELVRRIGLISDDADFPRPAIEVAVEALEAVANLSADRLFAAYGPISNAVGDMLHCLEEGLPQATTEQVSAYTAVVNAYDKKIKAEAQLLRRQVEEFSERLRSHPDDAAALRSFGDSLRSWDSLIQPLQLLARKKDRDEPSSRDLFGFVRRLTLDLANEKGAAAVALNIAKICSEVFAELPRAASQLADDLVSLQDLVDQAGVRQLVEFVDAVRNDLDPLVRDLDRGEFGPRSSAVAGRLFALFDQSVAATEGTSGAEYPWIIVRSLALHINNELGEGVASERLISGLRAHPRFGRCPAAMQKSIASDFKTLKSNDLHDRFKILIGKNDRSGARQALVDLVSLTDDYDERQQYQQVISNIDSARRRRIVKFGVWAVIALGVAAFAISENGGSSSRRSSTTYRPSSDAVAPSRPAVTSSKPKVAAETFVEDKPGVGAGGAFTRENIRYCLYWNARLDAVNALSQTETSNRVVSAINHEIADYNSRCGSYRYYANDMSAIEREVAAKQTVLTTEGRQLLQRWRAQN